MPKFTRMGALRVVSEDAWKMEIERAMRESEGRIPDAAKLLDISLRQLFRWLAEDVLAYIPRIPVGLPRNKKRGMRADGTPPKPSVYRGGRRKKSKVRKLDPENVIIMPSGKKVEVLESGAVRKIRRRRMVKKEVA